MGRCPHLSGPSLALPENLTGPILKKKMCFSKNAETTIFIRSGAFRGKRPQLQNRFFSVLGTSWSPPGPEPFPSRPPRSLPRSTLELRGGGEILPRAPRSLQGPHQIYKVGMLKTLEICVKTDKGEFTNKQIDYKIVEITWKYV